MNQKSLQAKALLKRRINLVCKLLSADKISLTIFPGGHSIVKNTGGGDWLDSLGSGVLVEKDILGFFKNIDLDNS